MAKTEKMVKLKKIVRILKKWPKFWKKWSKFKKMAKIFGKNGPQIFHNCPIIERYLVDVSGHQQRTLICVAHSGAVTYAARRSPIVARHSVDFSVERDWPLRQCGGQLRPWLRRPKRPLHRLWRRRRWKRRCGWPVRVVVAFANRVHVHQWPRRPRSYFPVPRRTWRTRLASATVVPCAARLTPTETERWILIEKKKRNRSEYLSSVNVCVCPLFIPWTKINVSFMIS